MHGILSADFIPNTYCLSKYATGEQKALFVESFGVFEGLRRAKTVVSVADPEGVSWVPWNPPFCENANNNTNFLAIRSRS